jgi:acyl carrier protein
MVTTSGDGMTREDVKKKVIVIVSDQLMVDSEGIAEQNNFATDLGADSLDSVELIMEFEDEFGIGIPDEIAEKVLTVGEAIDLIVAELSKKK